MVINTCKKELIDKIVEDAIRENGDLTTQYIQLLKEFESKDVDLNNDVIRETIVLGLALNNCTTIIKKVLYNILE
jgi:hypothetical protein